MSEVAQDSDVVVADEPALNQAETQDDKSEPTETETNDNDEQSPEGGSEEVEKSPEEIAVEAQKQAEQMRKKIDRQTAANSAYHRKIQQQQQELQALQDKLQAKEAPQEPKIDDFDTFEAFDQARVKFINDQAEQNAQQKLLADQQARQAQQQMQARMDLRAAQEVEYLTINPNYKASALEVDSFIKTLEPAQGTAEAVLDVIYEGNVPQIIDYFGGNNGENLDKLAEISKMTPVKAGIEIYKIQQGLKAPAPKESKPAPKPVNKPKGGGVPKKNLADGDVLKNLGLK